MGRIITISCGLFAAAVFAASLVVHVLALIPGTVLPFERIIWLHVLALSALFLTFAHNSIVRRRAARRGLAAPEFQQAIDRHVPRAVWALGTALFVYVILNFAYFAVNVEGTARIRDGQYVLMHKSQVIREISEAEYHEHRRLDARGASGHWMLFSGAAAVYFLLAAPRFQRDLEESSQSGSGADR